MGHCGPGALSSDHHYRGSHVVFMVYDVTDKRSYDSVTYWVREAGKYSGKGVLVAVVGLKHDLKDKGEYYGVNRLKEEAEIQSADIDAFFEASSKTGEGVDAVFQAVTEILTDRIRSQNSTRLVRSATAFRSGEEEKDNSQTLDTDGRREKERAKETEKEKEKKTEEKEKKTEKKEEEEKKKKEEEEEKKKEEKKGGAVKTATLLLLGDEAVGKTQLLQRFKGEAFSNVYCTTIGVDYATKNLLLPNAHVVKVMVVDTASKERFRDIARSYYRGTNGFIIVYDVTDENSCNNVSSWLKEVKTNKGDDAVTAVVGTKSDLRAPQSDKRLPGTEQLQHQLRDEGVHAFLEASAKTGEGVDDVFRTVAQLVARDRPGEAATFESG